MVRLVYAGTTTRTTMQLSSLVRTGTTSKWFATNPRPNPSIEGTSTNGLRPLATAPHVKRFYMAYSFYGIFGPRAFGPESRFTGCRVVRQTASTDAETDSCLRQSNTLPEASPWWPLLLP